MKQEINLTEVIAYICMTICVLCLAEAVHYGILEAHKQDTLAMISKDKIQVANIKKEMVFAAAGLEQRLTLNGQIVWVSGGAKPPSNIIIPELDTDIKVETSPAVK